MSTSDNACPVPFDQQPLNEFYALKNSCFFSFFGFKINTYVYSVTSVFALLVFLLTPLTLATIKFSWFTFLFNESICVAIFLTLILARLYLGWSYVVNRLLSASVFYEESGWYDGQIWIKSPEMLTKDRLVGTYYIIPLLKRIRLTIAILVFFTFSEILFFYLLC